MSNNMKYTFAITALIIIAAILLCALNVIHLPFSVEWSSCLQTIVAFGALIISGIALIYVREQYKNHKEEQKTALLCQYLNRFAGDEIMKKMNNYILETAFLDENENIIGFDKSKKPSYVPTLYEKELFMHYFEEIQLLIDGGLVDHIVAVDLMGYYVGIFHRIEEYHQDIKDYNDERYWKYYLKFVNNFPDSFYD